MRISLSIFFLFLLIGFSGCASSVGWGKQYQIVQSNSKTVTIEYDTVICSYKKVAEAVDAEAKKYGKVAVARDTIDSRAESFIGSVKTLVFDLVDP